MFQLMDLKCCGQVKYKQTLIYGIHLKLMIIINNLLDWLIHL